MLIIDAAIMKFIFNLEDIWGWYMVFIKYWLFSNKPVLYGAFDISTSIVQV